MLDSVGDLRLSIGSSHAAVGMVPARLTQLDRSRDGNEDGALQSRFVVAESWCRYERRKRRTGAAECRNADSLRPCVGWVWLGKIEDSVRRVHQGTPFSNRVSPSDRLWREGS